MNKKYIYLPIEIKVREFYPKLYLASYLAQNGFNCVLGDKRGVHAAMQYLPKGIYFSKSICTHEVQHLRDKLDYAHHIVCLDEESAIIRTELDSFFETRISQETLDLTSRFYCYGDLDYDYLTDRFNADMSKFRLTGSPRIDIWKPQVAEVVFHSQIRSIKQQYGDYILINSSIGVTSEEKIEFLINQSLSYGHIKESEVNERTNRLKYSLKDFYDLAGVANDLTKVFPNVQFIFRPHPAERKEDWENEIIPRSNIKILRDGDVTPWILACKALIHVGCTTALQAIISEKPVIAYRGLPSMSVYKDLNEFPNKISIQALTFEDLKQTLERIFSSNNTLQFTQTRSILKNRIYNLYAFNSAKLIAEDLARLPRNNDDSGSLAKYKLSYYGNRIKKILNKLKSKSASASNKELNLSQARAKVTDHKIPGGLTLNEIETFYVELSLANVTESNLRARKLGKNLFLITKK